MLVLTRKVGEGIAIGDDIKIIVMQVKGKQVRLGIKAKPETVVHREEIFQRIQEENLRASNSGTVSVASASEVFKTATVSSSSAFELGSVPIKKHRKAGKA